MLRVVSVSLGSSARDKTGRLTLLDETVELTRIGTDGDIGKAARKIAELDGQVDAIGLGGIDLYLIAGGRRYTISDARRLASHAKKTPVVDGSILKLLLEPRIVRQLAEMSQKSEVGSRKSDQERGSDTRPFGVERRQPRIAGATQPNDSSAAAKDLRTEGEQAQGSDGGVGSSKLLDSTLPPLKGSKVLLVSAVDRWGMAIALTEYAAETVFGDVMFALGLPVALHNLRQVRVLASVIAPVITKLPFKLLYPTGDKQKEHQPRYSEYFTWADWICGDFHYISRNLPPRLDGKVVLTNTTTEADQQRLRERGLDWLVTTTPVIDGRSFGMNVLEGCITALIARAGDPLTEQNYEIYLNKLNLQPNILRLNDVPAH
jgi:hypothetical protein